MGHKRPVRRVATLEGSSLASSVATRRNPAVIRLVPALKRRAIIKVSLRDTEICGCGYAALGSSVAIAAAFAVGYSGLAPTSRGAPHVFANRSSNVSRRGPWPGIRPCRNLPVALRQTVGSAGKDPLRL